MADTLKDEAATAVLGPQGARLEQAVGESDCYGRGEPQRGVQMNPGRHGEGVVLMDVGRADCAVPISSAGDHAYMLILAELDGMDQVYRHAVIEHGEYRLLHALSEDAADETVEAAGLINLWVVAVAIAELISRPLFMFIPPR